MRRWLKTVKSRIIAMVLCFALLVTTLVITFSYYLVHRHNMQISAQSIGFNLQLVSQTIERDLIEAVALANWCSIGGNPPARYLAAAYDPVLAVRSFERLQEECRNNRAYTYISRVMVISNTDSTRLLQFGINTSSNLSYADTDAPLPFEHYTLYNNVQIYDIAPDPYSRSGQNVITMLAPVRAAGSSQVIGTVYMALNTRIVTDSLRGYNLPEGAVLYLTIDGQPYRIEGDAFCPTNEPLAIAPAEGAAPGGLTIGTTTGGDGKTLDAVSCDIRAGLTLTQVYDSNRALPQLGSWLPLMLVVCLLILLLALLAIFTMNRTISRPVARIRQKMDKIAEGDFSPEPAIESDSEIGAVGKGINQLSQDVVGLMESRLADEQQKQELEYRMLQSQINPHFLYNSLGAIKWMATLQKADGIAEMTTALSRLLKTVSKDQRKVVPLREEIALLDDYYMILKYRYGGTVAFEKHIENDALLDCGLPRFVLQPLMENAIFHGIEPKGRGCIQLRVTRQNGAVCVCLWDDGVGFAPEALDNMDWDAEEAPEGSAVPVGMRSVHQRVRSVFGPEYGLTVESEAGRYTKTTLRIPFVPFSSGAAGTAGTTPAGEQEDGYV